MKNDAHLVWIKGEPDRLLETTGRDAEGLCGKEVPQAKCIGRLDVVAMRVETRTVAICGKCLALAVQVVLDKRGVTYVYGILPAKQADLVNAGKEEE